MEKLSKSLILFITAFFQLLSNESRGQSFSLNVVEPFSAIKISYPVNNRGKTIQDMNQGQFKILYDGVKNTAVNPPIIALIDEKKMLAFEIKNTSNKLMDKISFSFSVPQGTNLKAYQEVLINDWYSNQNRNSSSLNFYGDPLLLLARGAETFSISNLRPNESVRIQVEVTSKKSTNSTIGLVVKTGNNNSNLSWNYQVINKRIPNIEFSSIAFNGINVSSGSELIGVLNDVGFTHLQVNPMPFILFDTKGQVKSNGIDQTKNGSKSFRDVAYNWIKSGGKIALFWQSQYGKLASIGNGAYLKPYSKEWNAAYVNLVGEVVKSLKKVYNQFDESQLVIYIADEVSETGLQKQGGDVKALAATNSAIKRAFPKIQTMVTFGFYSEDNEVNNLLDAVDITVMHFAMPTKVRAAGRNFAPFQTKMNYESKVARMTKHTSWYYNVESGVTADIRDFRLLPMVSASVGMNGFSWWAFASHRGSTWTVSKDNGLNYSMYYGNESNNMIFNTWTKGLLVDQGRFIPSLRLKAARAGLLDAKIILAIKNRTNSLSSADRNSFQQIVNELERINTSSKENMKLPGIAMIELYSNKLRELYSKL